MLMSKGTFDMYNGNMKNRDYKNFASGAIVHVFNRGNNREKIFYDQSDYKAFLFRVGLALGIEPEILKKENLTSIPYSRIRINADKNNFKLYAFCLMPNHFHLLIEQVGDVSVSKLISQICTSYSMYINKKYKRVGHVFQERFKSVLVENNAQLMWLSSYIHMNPVKDGLVKYPSEYKWSSYNNFALNGDLPIINKELLLGTFGDIDNFKKQTSSFSVKDSP